MFRDPSSWSPARCANRPPSLCRARAAVRVGLVYGALEGALWSTRPLRDAWALLAAVLIVLFLGLDLVRGDRRVSDFGIGLAGFRRGAWVLVAAGLLSAAILFSGWRAGTLHHLFGPASWYTHAAGYAVWTLVQEFIAQAFFYLHLKDAVGSRWAIGINGLLFAAAHWPNPILVPVTLAGGWMLTALFARYRNLYILALAHTLVALSIAVAVPDAMHRHMRVGIGYLHYHAAPAQGSAPSRRPVHP